jgi:hypothetical protein
MSKGQQLLDAIKEYQEEYDQLKQDRELVQNPVSKKIIEYAMDVRSAAIGDWENELEELNKEEK